MTEEIKIPDGYSYSTIRMGDKFSSVVFTVSDNAATAVSGIGETPSDSLRNAICKLTKTAPQQDQTNGD